MVNRLGNVKHNNPICLASFPPFVSSVCFHNNTQEWKTGEKQGRPGSIHHVSGRKVDVGGRGQYSNIYILSLRASFLPVKTSSFHHAKVWSPKTR